MNPIEKLASIELIGVEPEACDFCRGVMLPTNLKRWFICKMHCDEIKKEANVIVQEGCGNPNCPKCGQKGPVN